jgi:nuclear protein localization protein 4 homolog
MLLDSQYEFKIQRQEHAICQQVSLDIPSITNFQFYVQQFAFSQKRIGYLYGKFVPIDTESTENNTNNKDTTGLKMKCIVEAIYEPSQEVDTNNVDGFILHDDNDEEEQVVKQIATLLGLQRVGWIFGHEYRNHNDYTLSSSEIIMAAEFQLEAADGVNETPFVTVTVAPSSPNNSNNSNANVSVEAFQVSQQCMAMVAEEALEVDPNNLKACIVNETYTAIQEGKASPTVDNSFFLTVVPIVQHTSDMFVAEFPRLNRPIYDHGQIPSTEMMKIHLSKSGTAGWTFIDRLADFNLLIYLSKFLDITTDYPKICASILDRNNVPLDDGYKLIIKSLAGMDGAY